MSIDTNGRARGFFVNGKKVETSEIDPALLSRTTEVPKKKRSRKLKDVIKALTTPSADVAPVVAKPKFELSDEQKNVVKILTENIDHEQVQTLGGLAGTGKTTVISHFSNTLTNFAFCAFTGKASEVLTSKGVPATTIHALIYNTIKDKGGIPKFLLKPSIAYCGIVVDEASMVSRDIYDDLLSFGLPIIFVGDHGQLEPVGDSFCIMKSPQHKLEKIHRNAGEIALFAHHLRNGGDSRSFETKEKVEIQHKDDGYVHLLDGADQIICAFNKTRVALNQYIRKQKGYPNHPVKGDRVISLRNSKKFRIYNGTQAVIDEVKDDRIVITIDKRTFTIPYDPSTFNQDRYEYSESKFHPFDYAYAITCHKAQGSEWDSVAVLEEKSDLWDHKRWAYTAASRARTKLTWIVR